MREGVQGKESYRWLGRATGKGVRRVTGEGWVSEFQVRRCTVKRVGKGSALGFGLAEGHFYC